MSSSVLEEKNTRVNDDDASASFLLFVFWTKLLAICEFPSWIVAQAHLT